MSLSLSDAEHNSHLRMRERLLPASPNWYCSRCSDVNQAGVLGFGAKNTIYLVKVAAASATVIGRSIITLLILFVMHLGPTFASMLSLY